MDVPSLNYSFSSKSSPFGNVGYAWKAKTGPLGSKRVNRFWTTKVKPDFDGERITLGDVLEDKFDKKYEVDASRIDEWNYAKGNKNEFRIRKSDRDNVDPELLATYDLCMTRPFAERAGLWSQHRPKFMAAVGDHKFYRYDEGTMGLDSTEKASRTVVTAEIGSSPSRMRHIFEDSPGRFRRLSPMETERLNMFPDNWTMMNDEKGKEIPDSKRGFMMGNALVVGIIQRLREPIGELIRRRRSI
jgi:DNA (cytosine-5)-methyltransferase 1